MEMTVFFDGIEGAIRILNQGSEIHQAMARRLRAILDAECIPTYDLLPVLGEIRKKSLLPEDAVLSLILNVAQYCSRAIAKELVGEREDFDDLFANRFDDLVAKLTETIDEFVRSNSTVTLFPNHFRVAAGILWSSRSKNKCGPPPCDAIPG